MYALVLLSLFLIASSKVYVPSTQGISTMEMFDEFNTFWNKSLPSLGHRQARFVNFLENMKKIEELNRNSPSARFGFTKFSDMSAAEFKRQMTGLKQKNPKLDISKEKRDVLQAPSGPIDWVAKGMTTPIKNQEQCGSCWAFSATETVESANLLAGKQVPLGSPQEIVDCDTNDAGCNGGDPQEALQWIVSQGGLDTETCYPYTAQDGTCYSQQCTASPALQVSQVTPVSQSEPAIYQALQSSPLSICCDASAWQNYNGGVLQGSQCGNNVDHAIQLTGYSPNQGGYWIVRNSWGADWGESGFIWLQYGQNTCDITDEVTGATA